MRPSTRLRDRFPIGLLISLALTLVLTLPRFNQSLWADEASSVWFSRQPITVLLTTLCDPHPPGYYLLLKFWTLFGASEAWLRVPSLLAGLGTIVVAYRMIRPRHSASTAALIAGMLALQPLHSWYASEVRMYALVEFAGLLVVLLGWKLIERGGSVGRWVAYAAVVELALWLDYTAVPLIALVQLMWIAHDCPYRKQWIVFHMIAALPILGWWLTSNQLASLGHSYQPVFVAVQAAKLGIDLAPNTAATLIQITALIVIAGSMMMALIARRRAQMMIRVIRLGAMVAWIGLLVFSILPVALTLKRLIVVGLPYVAIAGAGSIEHWPKPGKLAGVTLSLVAAALALITLQREPWRPFVQDITLNREPLVVWVDELSVPVFDYYWQQFDVNSNTRWTPLIGRALPMLPDLIPAPTNRLFIVTEETEYRHLIALLPIEFWRTYAPLGEQRSGHLVVYQYQRRLQPDSSALPPVTHTPHDDWGLLLPSPLDTCTP